MKQHRVVCRLGEGPTSLQAVIKAEEEVLAEAFRASEVSQLDDPPRLEPCEQLSPVSSVIQPVVPAPPVLLIAAAVEPHPVPMCEEESLLASQEPRGRRNSHAADLKSAEQMMRLVSAVKLQLPFKSRTLTSVTLHYHTKTSNIQPAAVYRSIQSINQTLMSGRP